MDPTVSVSKGCFVFKPPTKKKQNNRGSFENEPWYQCYSALWNSVEEKMMNVYEEIYSKVLKDLVYFVQHSHDEQPQMFTNHNIIPAATLITGVNMPDHGLLFERLSSLLGGVTQHVAMLHARECGTVKATVEHMISQFMNTTNQINNDEDSDDEASGLTLKKYQCNFMVLKAWYKEQVESLKSPSKLNSHSKTTKSPSPLKRGPSKLATVLDDSESESKRSPTKLKRRRGLENNSPAKGAANRDDVESPRKESCRRRIQLSDDDNDGAENTRRKQPLLVVVIPDFESFSSKVLQDFITIASSHAATLPITLVFGVATSVTVLHRSLPFHVSSKLSIEVFHSQKSYILLDHVLESVFLTEECPFHLGARTFRLFCEVFMFYDFSVQGFVQSLKFCMMEHFYDCNEKRLCCTLDNLPRNIAALDSTDLAKLKDMTSFQKYIETQPSKDAILKDNKLLKKEVGKLVRDLHNHMFVFHVGLRILQVMTASLPNAPLEKQIRHMYTSAVCEWIHKSPEYKESFKLLGFQSRDELLEKVASVEEILKEAVARDTDKSKPLVDVLDKLQSLHSQLKRVGMFRPMRSPAKNSAKSPVKSPTKTPTKTLFIDTMQNKVANRSNYYKNLAVGQEAQPLSPYEQVRQELLNHISASLGLFLAPISSMPLNEVLLFDNVSAVKRHIIGAPRAATHMVLNNPQYYLQCSCCTLANVTDITASLPDVSIAYKLHLECGKMINLYDWLQSFVAIVTPVEHKTNGQSDDGDGDHREVDPEIQARFTQAVAELQFLGFIKATKKKTDHVSRLTFNPK